MTSIAEDRFLHRLNRNGSLDSICKGCFQTIASCYCETALADAEKLHHCEGPRLLLLRDQRTLLDLPWRTPDRRHDGNQRSALCT